MKICKLNNTNNLWCTDAMEVEDGGWQAIKRLSRDKDAVDTVRAIAYLLIGFILACLF